MHFFSIQDFPYPLFFLLYRYSSGYQFNYLFDAKLQDIGWRTKLVFQENYGSRALRGMHNLISVQQVGLTALVVIGPASKVYGTGLQIKSSRRYSL